MAENETEVIEPGENAEEELDRYFTEIDAEDIPLEAEPVEEPEPDPNQKVDMAKIENQVRQKLLRERKEMRRKITEIVEKNSFTLAGEKKNPVTFDELWKVYDEQGWGFDRIETAAKQKRRGYIEAMKEAGLLREKANTQEAEAKKEEAKAKQEQWGKPVEGEVEPAVGKMTYQQAKDKGLPPDQLAEGIESGQIKRTQGPTFKKLGDNK